MLDATDLQRIRDIIKEEIENSKRAVSIPEKKSPVTPKKEVKGGKK